MSELVSGQGSHAPSLYQYSFGEFGGALNRQIARAVFLANACPKPGLRYLSKASASLFDEKTK
jgi:hypothetical protein